MRFTALAVLISCSFAVFADEALLTYAEVAQQYEVAQLHRRNGDDREYVSTLEAIAYSSVASPEPAAVTRADLAVVDAGIDAATGLPGPGTTSATDAYSLLGEYWLSNGAPERARPLLAYAAVSRSHALVNALRGEAMEFTYTSLLDALIVARNVRNTFKMLNEVDTERDPNLFRDLYHLAAALRATGRPARSREILLILAEEPAAGVFQERAEGELDS